MMNAIAEAFRDGPIKRLNVAPNAICEIEIDFKGRSIEVSWYSENDLSEGRQRMMLLDRLGLPVSDHQANEIFAAAKARAASEGAQILSDLLS